MTLAYNYTVVVNMYWLKKAPKLQICQRQQKKYQTITVIACCNADCNFLPTACVVKSWNKKPEFEDRLLPDSPVFMSGISAYITTDIFHTR
ncbi:hypothetical protein JTB14_021133 [Gonioctena quinquepunctata]|nr:hypothetical protein JTB14_021133 [Gonioctena quinquepunctata]